MQEYITEFVVDTITSYSEANRKNFPRTTRKIFVILENLDKDARMRKKNLMNVTVEKCAHKYGYVVAELFEKWCKLS